MESVFSELLNREANELANKRVKHAVKQAVKKERQETTELVRKETADRVKKENDAQTIRNYFNMGGDNANYIAALLGTPVSHALKIQNEMKSRSV